VKYDCTTSELSTTIPRRPTNSVFPPSISSLHFSRILASRRILRSGMTATSYGSGLADANRAGHPLAATDRGADLGFTLLDEAARVMHEKGEIAIITGALSAANQNLWISFIEERLAKYPNMKLVSIRPSDDDRDKAFSEAQTISKFIQMYKS
jgi:hypothetical protein